MKKALEKEIERLKLDWVNPHILSSFNPQFVSIKTTDISFEKGLDLLRAQRLRPATIYELLYWTEWDGKEQVLALGTIISTQGESYVPCLCEVSLSEPEHYYTERRLAMLAIKNNWKGEMMLLGVTHEN